MDFFSIGVESIGALEPFLETALVVVSVWCVWQFLQQRNLAQRVQANEQRMRSFLNSTLDGFVRFTDDGKILEVNEAFARMLRMNAGRLLGQSVWEFLPNLHQRTVQGHYEVEMKRSDGNFVPVRVSVTPSFSETAAIESLFMLVSDLTDRREYELTQRQISALLESTAEGIMILQSPDHILSINPAFTSITGYTAEDVVGESIHLLGADPVNNLFIVNMVDSLQTIGQWHGDIWGKRKNGEVYPLRLTVNAVHLERSMQSNFVVMFSDMSTLRHTQDELERMTHYDILTGLPNYSLFKTQLGLVLERTASAKGKSVVMVLGLDGFKEVNDRFGNTVGDDLLQLVAQRLSRLMHQEDILARMGGDRFVVVLPPCNTDMVEDPTAWVKKLILSLVAPFEVSERSIYITVSVGIAQYPQDGEDVPTLLKAAEVAMYASKHAGRNRACFHTSLLRQESNRRLALQNSLRKSLQQGELELWYQPQYALPTQDLTGIEALVRWRSPEHGLVSPADFIPLTKESGMILPLGEWVLREACMTAVHWLENGWNFGQIWVNVAVAQIEQSDFFATVQKVLKETGLSPHHLGLEITEDLLECNATHGMQVVSNLRAYGVAIAIDDFGVGYSSLSYLKHLPVNKLKIDKRFIADLPHAVDSTAITKAVVDIGHNLGFTLIAEGVETRAQWDFLRQIGCDEGQGYYLNHPLPCATIENLLRLNQVQPRLEENI